MPKAPVAFLPTTALSIQEGLLNPLQTVESLPAKRDCRPRRSDYLFRTSINLQKKHTA